LSWALRSLSSTSTPWGRGLRERIGTDAGWRVAGWEGEGARPLAGPASAPIRSRAVAGTARGGVHQGPGAEPGCGQILPTRSSDGFRVFSPSFHLAGQTSFGLAATYWAALSLRRVSLTSRAIALSWISTVLITPSGLMMKVPRRA